MELAPGAIGALLAGKRVEPSGLHGRDEPDRLSLRGDVVEPSPRCALREIEPENAVREMIPVMKIAEEPAVDAFFDESGLNRLYIHESRASLGIQPRME